MKMKYVFGIALRQTSSLKQRSYITELKQQSYITELHAKIIRTILELSQKNLR